MIKMMALAALLASSAASATVTVYTDMSSFYAAFPTSMGYGFDYGLAIGESDPTPTTVTKGGLTFSDIILTNEIYTDGILLSQKPIEAKHVSAAGFYFQPYTSSQDFSLEVNGVSVYKRSSITGPTFIGVSSTDEIKSIYFDDKWGGGGYDLYHVSEVLTGAVPEPATWALMIGGFGLVGVIKRRSRAPAVLAARL